jgi:arylsulfatase A-like enzyme
MKSPNILFIMVDQLRYDCLGFSQAYPVHTPNIDRLASEGVWFENAFTPIPICSPSRQALINGRRPETFGALWNFKNGLTIPALEPTEYAWPRELGRFGYRSVFFGKWDVHPKWTPTDYGYNEYTGYEEYREMIRKLYPDVKYQAGYFGEADPVLLEHSKTHWLAGKACEAMTELEKGEDPWYIQLNFTEPHLPCRPSGKFADMYIPKDIPVWKGFNDTFANKPYIQRQQLYSWKIQDFTWEDWAPIVARYYGIISQVDDAIGKVLRKLEQTHGSDRTIVIFTSDHGDMCGSHRMMDKHYILYDDVVKVPLIVRHPDMEAGQRCERFVYNMLDLPPTLLELLEVPTPSFFHGKSLLPLLKKEDVPNWRTDVVSTYNGQQFGLFTQRMLRTAQWKYIWNTTDVDELYNLEQDPAELNNRIYEENCAEVVSEYRRLLYDRLSKEGDGLVQSEWMRNQLLHNYKV